MNEKMPGSQIGRCLNAVYLTGKKTAVVFPVKIQA